jgi:hypothetical protein
VVLLGMQVVVLRYKGLEAFTTVTTPNATQVQGSARQAFLTFVSIPGQCMVSRDDVNRKWFIKGQNPLLLFNKFWCS